MITVIDPNCIIEFFSATFLCNAGLAGRSQASTAVTDSTSRPGAEGHRAQRAQRAGVLETQRTVLGHPDLGEVRQRVLRPGLEEFGGLGGHYRTPPLCLFT